MELGVDISTYFEELEAGVKYYRNGLEIDPLDELKKNGVNQVRIRIWNHPYSSDGHKYLGGTCDLNNFIELAKLVQSKGFEILADFHLSDFWCDPAKQFRPKSWADLSQKELERAVHDYIYESLVEIKNNNIDLKMIQVGNEITNGMLWPNGRLEDNGNDVRDNYDNFARLLKNGLMACKTVYPDSLLMLHLERSYDHQVYHEVLSELAKRDIKFDVLGVSYYPYWHHSFSELFDNLNKCQKEFGADLMIAETSYAFTLEDYPSDLEGSLVVNKENCFVSEDFKKEYPFTEEGQAKFIKDLLTKCQENNVQCVYYWEPLWIPGKNVCWASKEGQEYIRESHHGIKNEWANQCLFDYDGNMNLAFDEFKIK